MIMFFSNLIHLFLLNFYYLEEDDLAGLNLDYFSHRCWIFFITPDPILYEMHYFQKELDNILLRRLATIVNSQKTLLTFFDQYLK